MAKVLEFSDGTGVVKTENGILPIVSDDMTLREGKVVLVAVDSSTGTATIWEPGNPG